MMSEDCLGALCCPVCRSKLDADRETLRCIGSECRRSFPIVGGIPVLINETSSVFSIQDFIQQRDTFFPSKSKTVKRIERLLPRLFWKLNARDNLSRFIERILRENRTPRILVIGGGILGDGMDAVLSNSAVQLIVTDVAFGPRTGFIVDAHDIPFKDHTFDGVIAQSVLEHVADPYRCVAEIHRVLKKTGRVYAEIPFVFQVHGGRYDFTRFTYLGLRRLFRRFEEEDVGVLTGPGSALAMSGRYFMLSFVTSRIARFIMSGLACLLFFWLKYFDLILISRPAALDASMELFFTGRKSVDVLSDSEILGRYKGGYE